MSALMKSYQIDGMDSSGANLNGFDIFKRKFIVSGFGFKFVSGSWPFNCLRDKSTKPFKPSACRVDINFDVDKLLSELESCEHFGDVRLRNCSGSPHGQMTDIWVRYQDLAPFLSGERPMHEIVDKHDSEWLYDIPEVNRIADKLYEHVNGVQMGAVLITKLPAGGKIEPHTDSGWHAANYDKYFIPIKNEVGANFCWDDMEIKPDAGECWKFNNGRTHWVNNDSSSERIAMIICIRSGDTGVANEI